MNGYGLYVWLSFSIVFISCAVVYHKTKKTLKKYEKEFALDSSHTRSITEIVDKGATIHFNDDIVAFVPSRHLEKEDGSKLKKGEEALFKIIEFKFLYR